MVFLGTEVPQRSGKHNRMSPHTIKDPCQRDAGSDGYIITVSRLLMGTAEGLGRCSASKGPAMKAWGLYRHCSILNTHIKNKPAVTMHNYRPSSGAGETGGTPGICWPACLAECLSSRFREKPYLKKTRWGTVEEGTQH